MPIEVLCSVFVRPGASVDSVVTSCVHPRLGVVDILPPKPGHGSYLTKVTLKRLS